MCAHILVHAQVCVYMPLCVCVCVYMLVCISVTVCMNKVKVYNACGCVRMNVNCIITLKQFLNPTIGI